MRPLQGQTTNLWWTRPRQNRKYSYARLKVIFARSLGTLHTLVRAWKGQEAGGSVAQAVTRDGGTVSKQHYYASSRINGIVAD